MPRPREPLTRSRIVARAVEMIDDGGADGLTMRGLAGSLGVDPMAVYHHLPNKAAMVREAVEAVLAGCESPVPTGTWKARVRAVCRSFHRLAREHPGVFPLLCLQWATVPSGRRVKEALRSALSESGLSDRDVGRATSAFLGYAAGFALEELTGVGRRSTEAEEADFEFGLDLLLAGTGARATLEG